MLTRTTKERGWSLATGYKRSHRSRAGVFDSNPSLNNMNNSLDLVSINNWQKLEY